jgi:hypothetical protein
MWWSAAFHRSQTQAADKAGLVPTGVIWVDPYSLCDLRREVNCNGDT